MVSTDLLDLAQELGSTIFTLREETPLVEAVITRLTPAFGMEQGAVLLHDGQFLSVASAFGTEPDAASPLEQVTGLVDRLMLKNEGSDVQVITDLAELATATRAEDGHILQTLVVVPLASHAAPLGAIVLGCAGVRELQPAELSVLRIIGQLLATGLRERRVQVKIEALSRHVVVQGDGFDGTAPDPLTGLATRQSFIERLERSVADAVRMGGQLSLVMIDIDRFKSINEVNGMQFGDDILRSIAKTILGSIRGRDMAARYDGDEFCVLLPSTPGIGAVVVAERLLERISGAAFESSAGTWYLSISIGVACLSNRVTSTEQLLSKTEQGVVQAKMIGGNQVMFDWDGAIEAMGEE